jgi:hypothetical protein
MSYWNTNIPAGTFGDFTGVPGKYTFPGATGFNIPEFNADIPAGTFGSFPSIDGSAAGQAAFGGAAGGGLGSWGGMQAIGGITNTLLNQLGNAQGTQAGQEYLDFMADKRDADFGSALFERNVDIADRFRIPRIVAKMRANDPSIRQADRRADLANLAGKYGQLGGFLA